MAITIFTIGHGRRSIDELLAILRNANIELLIDVRALPRSMRHPWFNKEPLHVALKRAGIRYEWLGAELGGRRKSQPGSRHTGLRAEGLRAYADYMETPHFEAGIEKLISRARHSRTTIMCAETAPKDCHRGLIADYLAMRGINVEHFLQSESTQPHILHRAVRYESGGLVYDKTTQRDLALD
jgi:uncharacterized protein (DUF488 family)